MGITTSHQNRGVWGRSLSVSLVQVTDVCTLHLKVPVLAVTHVHITDIYCFQCKLLKKCQETSCLCTLLQRRSMSALHSQALRESDSVSAASPFMLLLRHRSQVDVFPPVQHLISTQGWTHLGQEWIVQHDWHHEHLAPGLCQRLESVQESAGRLREVKRMEAVSQG